jgi:hypothetical protein
VSDEEGRRVGPLAPRHARLSRGGRSLTVLRLLCWSASHASGCQRAQRGLLVLTFRRLLFLLSTLPPPRSGAVDRRSARTSGQRSAAYAARAARHIACDSKPERAVRLSGLRTQQPADSSLCLCMGLRGRHVTTAATPCDAARCAPAACAMHSAATRPPAHAQTLRLRASGGRKGGGTAAPATRLQTSLAQRRQHEGLGAFRRARLAAQRMKCRSARAARASPLWDERMPATAAPSGALGRAWPE